MNTLQGTVNIGVQRSIHGYSFRLLLPLAWRKYVDNPQVLERRFTLGLTSDQRLQTRCSPTGNGNRISVNRHVENARPRFSALLDSEVLKFEARVPSDAAYNCVERDAVLDPERCTLVTVNPIPPQFLAKSAPFLRHKRPAVAPAVAPPTAPHGRVPTTPITHAELRREGAEVRKLVNDWADRAVANGQMVKLDIVSDRLNISIRPLAPEWDKL